MIIKVKNSDKSPQIPASTDENGIENENTYQSTVTIEDLRDQATVRKLWGENRDKHEHSLAQ